MPEKFENIIEDRVARVSSDQFTVNARLRQSGGPQHYYRKACGISVGPCLIVYLACCLHVLRLTYLRLSFAYVASHLVSDCHLERLCTLSLNLV